MGAALLIGGYSAQALALCLGIPRAAAKADAVALFLLVAMAVLANCATLWLNLLQMRSADAWFQLAVLALMTHVLGAVVGAQWRADHRSIVILGLGGLATITVGAAILF